MHASTKNGGEGEELVIFLQQSDIIVNKQLDGVAPLSRPSFTCDHSTPLPNPHLILP